MDSIERVLATLVGDKKKLRCKAWEPHQYIWYWNKVVLDESGGIFDLALWLTVTNPKDWELFPSDEVKFRDLQVGERFKWISGDHIHIKVKIDKVTPEGQVIRQRFSAYNTVLNGYRDFGPEALVRRVSE